MKSKNTVQKFTPLQIEEIVEKVVPLIAAKEDQEFFRGILYIRAEEATSSSDFAHFVSKLLNR